MPINKGRRSGQAPDLALRNCSASYSRARQRPLYAALCVDARVRRECLDYGEVAMRLDKMRKPIIPQEPAIERWAFGPRRGSTKVEQRFSVGCLDDRRAEFGGRPDPLEAVEIRAGISASNAQPSGMG